MDLENTPQATINNVENYRLQGVTTSVIKAGAYSRLVPKRPRGRAPVPQPEKLTRVAVTIV
jgi:hypothetical protein